MEFPQDICEKPKDKDMKSPTAALINNHVLEIYEGYFHRAKQNNREYVNNPFIENLIWNKIQNDFAYFF